MPPLPEHVPRLKAEVSCARKNDALGWTVGCSFRGPRGSFAVRTNDASYFEQLKSWVPAWCGASSELEVDETISMRVGPPSRREGTRNYHLTYLGWERVARSLELAEVLEGTQALTAYMAARCCDVVMHLGDAVLRDGRVTVLVGESAARAAVKERLQEQHWSSFGETYVFYTREGLALPYAVPGQSEPRPVSDLLLVDEENISRLTPGQVALRLFSQASGAQAASFRLEVLGRVSAQVRIRASA